MEKEILIKGMVCQRCILAIRAKVEALGPWLADIRLGKLVLRAHTPTEVQTEIVHLLLSMGFEPMEARKQKLVTEVKQIIEEQLERPERKQKLSALLSERLHLSYDVISEHFSKEEGQTLEKYLIVKRIEKAHEAMVNSSKTFTQIAHDLGFSSVNHLSRQCKEITGLAPTELRKQGLAVQIL